MPEKSLRTRRFSRAIRSTHTFADDGNKLDGDVPVQQGIELFTALED